MHGRLRHDGSRKFGQVRVQRFQIDRGGRRERFGFGARCVGAACSDAWKGFESERMPTYSDPIVWRGSILASAESIMDFILRIDTIIIMLHDELGRIIISTTIRHITVAYL